MPKVVNSSGMILPTPTGVMQPSDVLDVSQEWIATVKKDHDWLEDGLLEIVTDAVPKPPVVQTKADQQEGEADAPASATNTKTATVKHTPKPKHKH